MNEQRPLLHPSASKRLFDAAELYDKEMELSLYLHEASGQVSAFWRKIDGAGYPSAMTGFQQLQYTPWEWSPQDLREMIQGSTELMAAHTNLQDTIEALSNSPGSLDLLCEKNEAFVQLWDALESKLANPPIATVEDSQPDEVSDIADDLINGVSVKTRNNEKGLLTIAIYLAAQKAEPVANVEMLSVHAAELPQEEPAKVSPSEGEEDDVEMVRVVHAMFRGKEAGRVVDDYYSPDDRTNVELAVRQALEDVDYPLDNPTTTENEDEQQA